MADRHIHIDKLRQHFFKANQHASLSLLVMNWHSYATQSHRERFFKNLVITLICLLNFRLKS